MSEYNPKNPDLFKQETLPEPTPLPLNITPVPEGSIVDRGDLSSPNFRESRAGWRIRSNGDAEFNDAIVRGTITIGGQHITVDTTDSIQEAINKVYANGGGVVVLKNGVHYPTNDIILYSNVTLQGQNRASAIIDFNSQGYSVVAQGTNTYSSGTVSISNNGTTVTGASTSWLTNATAGQSIMLDGVWYPIAVVGGDTSITIALPYAGSNLSGASYMIATPVYNVYIKDLTIRTSTDSAIKFYYIDNGGINNVQTQGSLVGFDFNYTAQCQMFQMNAVANYTNFKLFNTHYLAFWSAGCIDALNGHGFELDTVTNSKLDSLFILNSTGDGMNLKNCSNLLLNAVVSNENTGSGIEFVSGNDMVVFAGCGVETNGDSGLKLTATSDNVFIQNSLLKDNTGYGVNIVASTNDNCIITGNNFSGNTTSAINDSGTGTVIRGNVGVSDNSTNNLATSLGIFGDGSDGSANFDGSNTFSFATKSSNDYTLTRDVYLTDMTVANGCTVNPGGYRIFGTGTCTLNGTAIIKRNGNNGGNGGAGAISTDGTGGTAGAALADGYLKGSVAGKAGGQGNGVAGSAGDNTSNSIGNNGSAGGAGGVTGGGTGTGTAGGAGGTATAANVEPISSWHFLSLLDVTSTGATLKYDNSAGAGSGSAGGGGQGDRRGGGGGGSGSAGGIIAIYFKTIVIGASASITANGGNGGNGGAGTGTTTSIDSGGGGGGAGANGGQIILVYSTLTNSGSITATAGTGGTGGTGPGSGASGSNGSSGDIRQFLI